MSENNHTIDHGSPSNETNQNESIIKNAEAFSSSIKVLNQFISHLLSEMKVKFSSHPVKIADMARYDMFVLETLVIKTMICLDGCLSVINENSSTPSLSTSASNTTTTSSIQRRETDTGRLTSQESKSLNDTRTNAAEILPNIIQLIDLFFHQIRWTILNYLPNEDDNLKNVKTLKAYDSLLRMTTVKAVGKLGPFAMSIVNYLPKSLLEAVDKWNTIQLESNLPSAGSLWRKEFTSSVLPPETFAFSLQNFHFSALTTSYSSDESCFVTENANLKHVTSTLLKAAEEIFLWSTSNGSNHFQSQLKEDFAKILIPLGLDLTLESFNNHCNQAIESIWGSRESDEFLCANYIVALHHSFAILTEHSQYIDEKICIECIKLIESLLEVSAGQNALEKFFCDMDADETSSETSPSKRENRGIVSLITSASRKNLSSAYSSRILKFLVKLFELTEKNSDSISLVRLCSSLTHLRNFTPQENETYLQAWLNKLFCYKSDLGEYNFITQENRQAFQSLTSYIVKENSTVDEEVAESILSALIPIASIVLSCSLDAKGFPDLLATMTTLASAGSGTGHFELVKAVFGWLDVCSKYLSQKDVLEKLENNVTAGRHQIIIESTCYMLSYLSDVFEAFKLLNNENNLSDRPPSPTDESSGLDLESEWVDDLTCLDDDESAGDESDEDSLCNKLCTFTITLKNFMNQHWYHCHTCKLIDGVGVCTVCAKVCHKDHDVTFSKYGSFFCDCGAKQDGSCLALTKRTQNSHDNEQTASYRLPAYSCSQDKSRRRPSSPDGDSADDRIKRQVSSESHARYQVLARQLQSRKRELLSLLTSRNVGSTILDLLNVTVPSIIKNCQANSSIGCSIRAKKSLKDLHEKPKSIEYNDVLMVPTLGSQEGAFENVRLSYSGEQGQAIRQLVSTNVIRRVAMCALVSPFGKRQHLAVSHEKGKITLLQLSTLLKQADCSKKKFTLSRLASAPIPFTVLSMASNPCNEDFLAVCGLKDCHVLTFNPNGNVSGHLVLHPMLEAGNYLIKSVWLPGTQTELALITMDFVKVYNLSVDVISPQFFFLLPSGKIRDVTFVITENQRYILIISSAGHIYSQILSDESSARHGPFYVTNVLDVKHSDIRETSGGQINSGGVSIYYSHMLQLLFTSYSNGKSFVAALTEVTSEISHLFPIELSNPNRDHGASPPSNGGSKSSSSSPTSTAPGPQPLCQWSEIQGHPGLVCAVCQPTGHPVIFMIKTENIIIHEIQFTSTKSKITDMVPVRHTTSAGELRTTLILLCEDGSLRIYMANPEGTNFWLQPSLCSAFTNGSGLPSLGLKSSKKRKSNKPNKLNSGGTTSGGTVSFPIDFFEHCTLLTDIEYGGNDVLQVYNVQQLKNRLNATGMYIASTKPEGFTVEVTNNDPSMVIVGVRIFLGTQDTIKVPSYIEIFGRPIHVYLTRNRWYDFPLTREESLMADRKLSIFFGASGDPNNITMVDSIKVYGKTKEAFAWPDEDVENVGNTGTESMIQNVSDFDIMSLASPYATQLSSLDRLLSCMLEVLDGSFTLGIAGTSLENKQQIHKQALEIVTNLLTYPFPVPVHQNIKYLLLTLHQNKSSFNNHRDAAILNYVIKSLSEANAAGELDGEAFYRLIILTKSIAISRPENLIKFSECLTLAMTQSEQQRLTEDQSDNADLSSSKSCSELLSRAKSIEGPSKPTRPSVLGAPQRSVSFVETVASKDGKSGDSFLIYLSDTFWKLYCMRPKNPLLTSIASSGLVHVEATVQVLVEIIIAFTLVDVSNIGTASQLLMKLFLCKNPVISFGAKQALIRLLSPKQFELIEELDQVAAQGLMRVIDAPLLEFPDVDDQDDPMADLAIVSSLQEQAAAARGLSVIEQSAASSSGGPSSSQRGGSLEDRSHYSDTTASAAGSDDEGSTAATDGSTLRTSPVANETENVADGGGSESGASGVESVIGEHVASGRSSTYGDDAAAKGQPRESQETGSEITESEKPDSTSHKLHNIRLYLLEKLVGSLSEIRGIGGIHSVSMMQVIVMLSSDLDCSIEKDKAVFMSLLNALINELHHGCRDAKQLIERTPENEVKLIIMRLLSILMTRMKSTSSGSSKSTHDPAESSFGLCSLYTAQSLLNSETLDLCLQTLINLKDYWKNIQPDIESSSRSSFNQSMQPIQTGTPTTTAPLKPRNLTPVPDMSPFFLKQFVKSHSDDIFATYPQLLTEMVLKLPYQIKKISNSYSATKQIAFPHAWLDVLCEYMMIQLAPMIRKQVRKLLNFICGSKEKYRQVRDFHALEYHFNEIKKICQQGGFNETSETTGRQGVIISLTYDSTIVLIEHLKACCDIASSRTLNWQKFCRNISTLTFFMRASFLLDEGVSPIFLQLLQYALCRPIQSSSSVKSEGGIKVPVTILQGSTSVSSSMPPESTDIASREQANLAALLAQQFITQLDRTLLNQFIQCFLLESNSSSLRMQTHSLIFNMYKNIDEPAHHKILLEILWSLWDKVPCYGRKAGQFVDLLAYFTLKSNIPEEKEVEYRDKALSILRHQNKLLINHPNSALYNSLQNLVEFDGYYLESEPCLVCNNPEVSYSNMKLSSVKVDSRFTTTTQIVKLVGSHTISKISLRIADIKRSKMVKTLIIYYNNRSVHSVVELKNKTGIWHKAKKCQLASGQTEVKIEFPLPIVACNLMIEYADFYENIQASSETLQCPRCSASVPANPGVCGNCGENVFQCHKCRSINYDEKDPFLCNSCGFSKYAKFDYTLTAKPTFSVDPIENEEDRKKTVQTINTLLEKADRVYKGLIANKPTLELLLLRIQEHGFMDKMSDEALGIVPSGSGYPSTGPINVPTSNSSSHVNRAIQQVAHKYCVECKGSFDELSKIIQKVLASRKELVDYDNVQRDSITTTTKVSTNGKGSATRRDSKFVVSLASASGRCYGCACAVVELCITLLKALGTQLKYRKLLCSSGLLQQLVDYNLRTGSSSVRQEVRQLLVTLTLDNPEATDQLNDMLMYKIIASLVSPSSMRHDLTSSVRHEIALLICSLEREDSCWEKRLRCVLRLFRVSLSCNSPSVLESITLPCLKLLINLIKPDSFVMKKKEKTIEQMAGMTIRGSQISVDLNKWLAEDNDHNFNVWKKRCAKSCVSLPSVSGAREKLGKSKEIVRSFFLMEKYGNRWKEKTIEKGHFKIECKLIGNNWLRSVLFNKFSRTVRLMACSLVGALFQTPSRRKELIDILTCYLDELGIAREYSQEFFTLYHSLIRQDHWKYYLALKGVLLHLGSLITNEIEKLNELEEITLNSDLSEGCALKMLVDLLTVFVDVPSIRKQYKSRLVAFILNGYLSLRKLVVQRTKIIDETQDNLLELLEEMTTGTESETSSFMAVCVEAVNKCKLDDLRTPVFIFERLCSIIYPEENDTSEFFINLEKDPQHEDFLQGRMLGNPYPSTEPGMGPLMRDIKNKICQDCELIALLEDDSGMELLVCNKIISLDLPVEEVYKKIWLTENNETEAMRVIYRMRGLMGDATEEFIQTLDSKNNENVDNEQVFKMANVMSECGGLEVLLQRLAVIQDLSARSRPLLLVLLKLFDYCVKVRQNRQTLIDPSLKAINVLLNTLKMAIIADPNDLASCVGGGFSSAGKPNVLEMILVIMESILVEASKQSREEYDRFYHETCGAKDDIKFLLNAAEHENVRHNTNVMHMLMKVIPLLTLGDKEKMATLLDHFRPHLNFNKFDFDHTPENDFRIDCFCVMLHGIEKNENGNRLKDFILNEDIVSNALAYLKIHAPPVKSALLATSEEWKEFTQRPVLKYVLRMLTGLCSGHPSSQMLVAAESIPVIHGLEQVSSDSHVGSLAEMLLEALKYQNSVVSEKIEHVRKQTKEEKKKLAMAVRQKQLGELGMKANERGQVMAKSSILRQVEDLGEEQGLSCIICREGYKFQPSKVLGIYTFTKECPIEQFELKPRKTMGYSTVTHFNVVHVDCHMAAVRHARGRDEWESAALQNASTKCNGLLPLWGPSVQESAFASCLARHNTYLQECTGRRDISYSCTIHDLKLLLLRFASEESFSLDSGGGGPQSNIHLIPYMIHMALYVINTTRCAAKESKKITASFLDLPPSKWVENSFEADSPFYWTTISLVIHPPFFWKKHRLTFLKRLLIAAQARHITPKGANHLIDNRPLDYSVYKSSLIFFALIDSLYSIMFKMVLPKADENSGVSCETWTLALAEYIRNNDQALLENGDKLLRFYEQDLLLCQSFYELIDVLALHHLVPDPDTFLESCFRLPLN
ncbi:E3 ubiquitin-protein ligase UBR4-like isoform X2 [Tetranychus urticae]|uniref:E3 ubiquitin-protein ligase UBR4-like isoform X2 n=1 Tax=Tetranychus urticae TaxID=32264 RepID=UPI00077BC596|nr:E3 ubiquitin-protein ligase UBR4-like isoform X2 [Tetranychus urticae]